MRTNGIFSLVFAHDNGFPSIDFSIPANRNYNWLELGEMLDGQKPIDLSFTSSINITVTNKSKRFDCLSFNGRLLISSAAKQVFEGLQQSEIRYASLFVNSLPYYLMIVDRVIDCLDRDRSEIKSFPGDPTKIMAIKRYVLRKEAFGHFEIFRIPEHPTRVFVTESVKERIEASSLAGFGFTNVENPPPGIYLS
ncbi:MAG: imm11 family protein [Limisphaerales bacterium]